MKSIGRIVSWEARIRSAPATCAASAASSAPPYSTSSTADSGGSSFHSCGAPTMFQAAVISAGATISSTALAPLSTSSRTGAIASSMLGKWTQAVVVSAGSGTVSKTTSARKASVPSEPTTRRRKISSGSSASRKAQSRYPVVFLISNLRRIRALSSASARISSRIAARPAASSGSAAAKASAAPGAAVSMRVPEGRTKVIERTVE